MTYSSKGILIVCDLSGKIKTVHYCKFNNEMHNVKEKLFIDLFRNESIGKALGFFVEIKTNTASFGWELLLKPEYTSNPVYFGGALIDDGITIFGSDTEVDYSHFASEMTQIQNEQINTIRMLEKDKFNSSLPEIHLSSSIYDELSRLNNELVGMQRELAKNNEELIFSKNTIEESLYENNAIIEELSQTKDKLEIINSEKDKFFSIIAHDLKSPFTGFITLTEMLALNVSNFSIEELKNSSIHLNKKAKSLFKLLQNLLEWAQMQRGSVSFNPITINLSELVSENIDIIEKQGEQKGVSLLMNIPENQKVFADESMLNSIIRNLISNAVKFTGWGGNVNVRSKIAGCNMLDVSVIDCGIGMSTSLCNKLFKLEEKVGRPGTEGEESTGLGLLLCKEFVEKNGGKIWVESKEGIGSTFYFTLPLKS